jgi:hypothetical protein
LVNGTVGCEAVKKLDELMKGLATIYKDYKKLRKELIDHFKRNWQTEDFKKDREYITQVYLSHFGGLENYREVNALNKSKEAIRNRSVEVQEKVALRSKDLRKANDFYNKVAKEVIGDEYIPQNDEVGEGEENSADNGEENPADNGLRYEFLYILKSCMALYFGGLVFKVGCGTIDLEKIKPKFSESVEDPMDHYCYKYMGRLGGAYDPECVKLPRNPDLTYRHAEFLLHMLLYNIGLRLKLPRGNNANYEEPGKSKEFYNGQFDPMQPLNNKSKEIEKKNTERMIGLMNGVAAIFDDTARFVEVFARVNISIVRAIRNTFESVT